MLFVVIRNCVSELVAGIRHQMLYLFSKKYYIRCRNRARLIEQMNNDEFNLSRKESVGGITRVKVVDFPNGGVNVK